MKDVRVVINKHEIYKLWHHPDVQDRASSDAAAVADTAQSLAPRDTGEGADSIHEEQQPDGTWRISWDAEHDYMRFQELGTEHNPPKPFLRPAADRIR